MVVKLTVFLFLSKMNKLMKISDNEAHSATYRSENEHFARRCRHYKSKDCKAECLPYAADAGQAAAQEADAAAQQAAQEAAAADQTAASGEDAQTMDDGAAQNEAAIAALPAESPRFYLTQYSVEVERGAELNRLGYVQDITDDKDSRDELYQGIQISGEVDTNTPGEYMLEYYVVDSDGNTSNTAQLKVTVK